ncbi:hypothetical protein KBK19_05905 [Microvirga sp. STR05]|uniref:Uncharacterized protein n=1 Tax=Hymenobacter duratus TaxID=2771356 RepID=A0ABR8JCN4_9BACT|nr:hypothetical protein [Hymenobacter duratus]MBD2714561.1 hypothetical protein [Hymenobacter duratus]MBR7949465.1 hypothetical protein [Microvirga sp. STR05]
MPSNDWLHTIPADLYDQLAHCLSLHGMACAELLSRPQEAQLLHLMSLTGLNTMRVAELNAIADHNQLLHTLEQQPHHLYNLMLLGRLSLETSLAAPVLRYVQQQMRIDTAQLQQLKTYCLELSGAFLALLEEHLPTPSLGLHRLQVEEAFGQYIALHPGPEPTAATIRFTEPQLQMMRLALLLVHSLPEAGEHPFLQAVAELAALRPAALEPMIERLGTLEPAQDFAVTMPELVQLYQAMQVCGMVFVSEVLEKVGLGSVFPTVPTDERPASAGAAEPSGRQAVGEIVSGFTRWVQYTFPQEPALQQARQQVLALADAL